METYELSPGDAFYLPRGFLHEAVTASSSALHITVGVYVKTWAHLIGEVLRLVAEQDANMQKALPPRYFNEPINISYLMGLIDEFAKAIASSNIIDRARVNVGNSLVQHQTAGSHQFRSIDSVTGLCLESVLTHARNEPVRVRETNGRIVLEYPGNYVSVPKELAPILRFVVNNRDFKIQDLPGSLSDSERIEFASRLVNEGFLKLFEEG